MTARHAFVQWFAEQHADADTSVGDLARYLWNNPAFPDVGAREELRLHLLRVLVLVVIPGDFADCWEALDAFEDAWDEWAATVGSAA